MCMIKDNTIFNHVNVKTFLSVIIKQLSSMYVYKTKIKKKNFNNCKNIYKVVQL